ncbi:MAG: anhydro-N-acetylmuramic acid kinase [Gemmatimonadaceae bacterium]
MIAGAAGEQPTARDALGQRDTRRRSVVIGLMSGTSLDGISAAAVRFHERGDGRRLDTTLLGFSVREYTRAQRDRLTAALTGGSPAEYCRLGFDLGGWLADAAIAVLAEAGVARDDVLAVASHGQTIWHEPGHSTWQIGEAAVIAERTGLDVVSDFRVRDVAAGGHGAPLVSVADSLLFASDSEWRALQNVGGIGNVSVVPPGGDASGVRAFDTGPGVAVIDGVVRRLLPELHFDVDGRLALAGSSIEAVVDTLLADAYFAAPPPKSTGRELFSESYVARFVDACRTERKNASVEDIVATAISLTTRSIGDAYRRFLPEPVSEVLVSGGGARNPALFAGLARELAPCTVRRFDEVFFDGEAKEAVAFALLGYLHVHGRPGNVPGATGARGGRTLGKRTPV